jgi:hypothetical protein
MDAEGVDKVLKMKIDLSNRKFSTLKISISRYKKNKIVFLNKFIIIILNHIQFQIVVSFDNN